MRFLWMALLLAALSGCTAMLLGGGGNDGTTARGSRTQTQIEIDSRITAEVRNKLVDDSVLSEYALSVQTFDTRVTLRGAVTSASERDRAARLAGTVQGVTGVDNRIRIGPGP
jgi:hyperosmotically inducible periplasmic protein